MRLEPASKQPPCQLRHGCIHAISAVGFSALSQLRPQVSPITLRELCPRMHILHEFFQTVDHFVGGVSLLFQIVSFAQTNSL